MGEFNLKIFKLLQRRGHYLIHVVVAVVGQSSNKSYVFFTLCKSLVVVEYFFGVGCGDWVKWLHARTVVRGIFPHDSRVRALLPGGMLQLNDAGKFFAAGVIHLQCGLPEALSAGNRPPGF